MRFACLEYRGQTHWGCLEGTDRISLESFDPRHPELVNRIIEQWHGREPEPAAGKLLGPDARLLAPVPAPGKIICIGRNYADHAAEMGSAVEELPVVFNKFASSIIGPDDPVRLPSLSEQVDYEAELVVVIGKTGNQIPREQALNYVFGYCCGNDVSARDWQKGRPGGQWLLGKTFDSFAPLGPWIASRDTVDPGNLDIKMRLNGELRQSSNTGKLIFPVDHLIAHVSRFCTLQPGDLLFTGTPAGVGAGRNPPEFLIAGDQMQVEISGIGLLRNPVERA